ncbi:KilA-N domain-containing protein [Niabella sp.]|uniref:KilA-N domain-containing protein n=1 Tax=Niabella sp. TaxID=1962976 RepID=UPI00262F5900|nr:KilA-N domain-containing protein [Niabella sp.]
MTKSKIIEVEGREIAIISDRSDDFISLTDIAKHKNEEATGLVISHWLSTRYTVEFMGLWEQIHNPNFNVTEFSNIKSEAGSNGYVLSSKQWITKTNAIGIISKTGRYGGGTFAHRDIAFEFASWISASFKLYLIKEFQRLKDEENNRLQLDWNLQRTISKINYHIHTDAIKENLVPKAITSQQASYVYANEADLLNVALFGITANEWRHANPGKPGNIRDYATLEQLVVLSNMESINALLIKQGLPQGKRLLQLNQVAITQMKSLLQNKAIKRLK